MRCVNLEPFCFFCPGEKIWNLNCGIRPQRDARLRCSASFTNDPTWRTVTPFRNMIRIRIRDDPR